MKKFKKTNFRMFTLSNNFLKVLCDNSSKYKRRSCLDLYLDAFPLKRNKRDDIKIFKKFLNKT